MLKLSLSYRVEPLDVVPDQIHPDMPLTTTDNEEGSRHYYDSETGEWMHLYEVCKGTICIEYANQDISSKGDRSVWKPARKVFLL